MPMERELGISQLDLPHRFEREPSMHTCTCGRAEHDSLHEMPKMQEQANYSGPALQTEKGS